MYNFSDIAKERLLNGKITRAYLKVLATDTQPEMIINESNYLKNVKFEELRYVPNEGIIGGTVAKRVTGEFNNVDSSFSIQDREFELYIGVDLNSPENDEEIQTEYIKYGTFIVQKPEDNQINDNTSFEALDYMIKANKTYIDRITYPCTLKALFNDVVAQAGLQTNTVSFLNDSFIVDSNQFDEGVSCRDVLKAIAQVAFNWVRIDENNKLVMDLDLTTEKTPEEINNEQYFEFSKSDTYGPLNVIIFKNSQIEGENVTIKDSESISEYGETEFSISDNPFAYTQEKRQQLIEAGRNLFGLTYTPCSIKDIGFIYLNCNDKISIENLNGEKFITYIFDHTIDYEGTATSQIDTQAQTKTETKYQFEGTLADAVKRTEAIVDKANQKILLLVSSTEDLQTKTSQLILDVDKIEGQLSDIADVTVTAEGYGKIAIDNINQSEPIEIRVHPTSSDIIPLYPKNNLFPNKGLYPHKREILFKNNNEENPTNIQYNIPANLYYLNGVYDEFVLNYENQECYIIHKIGIDENGNKYELTAIEKENFDYPKIDLTEGDYVVSLPAFSDAYLYVRLMVKNLYTDQFATKVELKSSITLAQQEISIEVSKKVDQTEYTPAKIIARINEDVSEAMIEADKISLIGKQIDMTSDNVSITSTNFSVDKNGNMTCKNAKITGGNLSIGSNFSVDSKGNMTATNAEIKLTDSNGQLLMKIDSNGQHFYSDSQLLGDIGRINYKGTEMIAFNLNATTTTNSGMAWGIKKGNQYYPIFYTEAAYMENEAEYGGYLSCVGMFSSVAIETTSINVDTYINGSFLTASTYVMIPQNSTQGYGLCNDVGISIIRDLGNKNVAVDATGSKLYLGYQNTVQINALNGKMTIDSSGNIKSNGNITIDTGSIKSLATYNNSTVTNAPNMYVTSNGWIRRTTNTSSRRYKKDIQELNEEELNPQKLYDLKVKQFKYKDKYQPSKNDIRYNKTLIGFIAEEVAEIFPIAADYEIDENGNKKIENWNEKYIIPAMLYLIQEQNERIKRLEEKENG